MRRPTSAVLLILLPAAWAAAEAPPSRDQVKQEIRFLYWLHPAGLTSAQLDEWLAQAEAAATAMDGLRERLDAPAVHDALLAVRAAVAATGAVPDELLQRLNAARREALGLQPGDDLDDDDSLLWDAALPSARAMVAVLQPHQVAVLALDPVAEVADDLLEELRDGLDEPPDEWEAMLDDEIGGIVEDRGDDEALDAALREFAGELRATPVDDIFADWARLRDELIELLTPQQVTDEMRGDAVWRLCEALVELPRLATCLRDLTPAVE